MKRIVVLISSALLFLTVFMFACQSELESASDFEIPELEIYKGDAGRKLSHKPTGEVSVKTQNQPVKIDFSLGEYFTHYITTYDRMVIYTHDTAFPANGDGTKIFEGNIHDIPTLGKLVDIYKRCHLKFSIPFSSYSGDHVPYEMDAVYVLPKLEYALAQECFQDDCNTQTRKAILQMVAGRHKKHDWDAVNTLLIPAKKTGIFLMAVVLIKEKDAGFIAAIHKNPDLQKAIRLEVDMYGSAYWIDDLYDLVSKYAIAFLSD